MDFSSIVSMQLEGMGVNVSAVFDLVTVWPKVFKIVALIIKAFG